MKFKYFAHTLILILYNLVSNAQNGAYQGFKFLSVNPSAKIAALGGTQVSSSDIDLSASLQNPALLNYRMNDQLSASYVNHISDANYGLISYAKQKKYGMFAATVQYFNAGKFIETDETSTVIGKFQVNEVALGISWSKKLDSVLSVGVTTKYLISSLEQYTAQAVAFDIGATYTHPAQNFSAGIVLKNFGFQTKKYTTESFNLPLDLQVGLAYKLEHVPFRISITGVQLNRRNLVFVDSSNTNSIDPITNQVLEPKKQVGANIASHFVFGGEFLFTKNFQIRLGYNYKRRNELKLIDRPGSNGFSFGFGLKLSKWQLNYAFTRYHFYGNSNHITLNIDIANFAKKKV